MRNIVTYSLLLIGGASAFSQERTDTIKTQELHEIVFEASNQRTSANVSTYYPAARQKNAAADAVSLLSQMAIPQLSVDPSNRNLKNLTVFKV